MTREQFDQLVRRMDERSRRDPAGFVRRVAALAVLGYAYMLGVLLVTASLAASCIWLIFRFPNGATLKLGLLVGLTCGGMAWSILRALWVRTGKPEAVPLTAAEAPELFALIADVGRRTDSPAFDEVQLTGDYNAAVVQVPRLGVFGWYRSYLLIGVPLMVSLGRDELAAVLAHEFGHLSRSHGSSGTWLYRIRQTWESTMNNLAQNPPGKLALVLTWFLGWFWPRFNASAFVLSRAQEYEADAAAARATSAAALASALQRLVVDGPLLDERLWAKVLLLANDSAEPPGDVYHRLSEGLRAGPDSEDSARWLRAGFLLATGNADTHPSLTDRLRALGQLEAAQPGGQLPTSLAPPAGPRAITLLGTRQDEFMARLNQQWAGHVREAWQARHAEAQELKSRLGGLAETSDRPLSVEELWQRAEVKLKLENDAAAVPLLDQILALRPDHALANLVRGRHWLETEDPRGVEHLERAIRADASVTEPACQLLFGHFARTGQRERQREVENRLEKFGELQAAAQRERDNVTAVDTFLPPALSEDQLRTLREAVAAEPAVVRAHLARKEVHIFPENPCHVLAVFVKWPLLKAVTQTTNQELVDRILGRLQFSGYLMVFIAADNLKSLGQKIAAEPGSLVFARDGQ